MILNSLKKFLQEEKNFKRSSRKMKSAAYYKLQLAKERKKKIVRWRLQPLWNRRNHLLADGKKITLMFSIYRYGD